MNVYYREVYVVFLLLVCEIIFHLSAEFPKNFKIIDFYQQVLGILNIPGLKMIFNIIQNLIFQCQKLVKITNKINMKNTFYLFMFFYINNSNVKLILLLYINREGIKYNRSNIFYKNWTVNDICRILHFYRHLRCPDLKRLRMILDKLT